MEAPTYLDQWRAETVVLHTGLESGLMLLLHRSGRVLEEDFKDLDQSTKRGQLVERLGENIYQLGYWQDEKGVFWGISGEAGETGGALMQRSEKPLAVQARPDLGIVSIAILLSIAIAFAGVCLTLAVESRNHQGISPRADLSAPWKLALLWFASPMDLTIYIFNLWWSVLDMHFRCTQPFVDMIATKTACETIAADYCTTPALLLPFIAAKKENWRWFLVSSVSILMPIMISIAGSLFIFKTPTMATSAKFAHTHIGTDVVVQSTRVQLDGREGDAIESVNLREGSCSLGLRTTVTSPCSRASSYLTAGNPNYVCSSWKLFPLLGGCDYDGWWWICWQSGRVLGRNTAGLPIFASAPPPISASLIRDTSLRLAARRNDLRVVQFQNR
ncbi:hypothetical protein FGG08_007043 [Glutinoglossum americanum]|uniref:Uncharacterized protein n=1 Tax=Glutinoglossum americanum TaxID=1670608 RepID=A0A9P8HZM6_9PEZI|nr:hypothetical protein FGG08_007043 [Glutinoglossum americanum]